MSGVLCSVLSVIMIAVGGVALYVSSPDSSSSMTIEACADFLGVICVLGLISCLLAE